MKHCLFSISYAGLWGQERIELESFIGRAARLGYQGVMIAGKRPHLAPLDATPEMLLELKNHLKREGVECPVLAAYTDFSGAGATDVPFLEIQIGYVESLARIAPQLGAQFIRVFTAYENEAIGIGTSWAQVVDSLRECCDRAASHGVALAVQNHHDVGVHTDALLELLKEIDRPNCKLAFDAWSPALRGEDLHEAARKAAPFTAITTSADYVRLPRFRYDPQLVNYQVQELDLVRAVPFGDGFIDYQSFFKGLLAGGFDGIASYEMCSPLRGGGSLENLDLFARRYLDWVKQHGF